MEWLSENKFVFIILIGLLVVLIIRDLLRYFIDYKIRQQMKRNMAESERRIDALMDALHKDRLKLRDELASVDQRFKDLQDVSSNPDNPAHAKQ